MRMRKLFAGVAAAATLLGGLALGATTASAAPVNGMGKIQLNNATPGVTYTAYKIAGYADPEFDPNDAGRATGISVTKVSDTVNTAVQDAAIAAWNEENDPDVTTVPQPYQENAAAWVATWKTDENAAELRKFADNLATKTGQLGEGTTLENSETVITTNQIAVGWYLVVSDESKPLLVGTRFFNKTTEVTKLGDQSLGVIAAKRNETALTPVKKILESDGKTNLVGKDGATASAKVGDYVKYELSTVVPNTVGYPEDNFRFYLTDTMDESLTYVNDEAHRTTVTVNNKQVQQCTEDYESNCTGDYYRSTESTYTVAGKTTTNRFFYLDKYIYKVSQDVAQVGTPVTVTYYAKINEKAVKASQSNNNSVSLDISKFGASGTDMIKGNTVKVYTYNTSFTKVQADGTTALPGADFKVKDSDNKWLTQEANGVWGKTANEADAKVFTSGNDGVVSLEGLSEGVYTVKETKAPTGYLQATIPTFTVTITDKDADGVLDGQFTATFDETTLFGLVSQDEETGAATVQNVKNISQLPLTGAAGIAMFLVLAVALGGVAAVTYSKSRSTARALRA